MQKKLWNKDFILMLQGNAISDIGDILYSVAIGYWVYEKTGSSTLMGVMSSISMFMTMFVMPFSGSIIDKCDRKWVIVGMDIGRGAIMLAVGVLALIGKLTVPGVLVAAFLAAACSVFFNPAVETLMIDLIPHDDMVRGKSVHAGIQTSIGLVGKAFSGALVAMMGVPVIILVNGVSYLLSAFTEMFIAVPKTKQQGEKVTIKGLLQDFASAIKAIFSDKSLKIFVPCALLVNLLGAGPGSLMLPFVLEKGFTVDMYGYLMSVQTAASLVCVFVLGTVKMKPRTRYYAMSLGFITAGIFSVAAYLTNHFMVMCVMLFLNCFTNTMGNGVFNSAMMLALPEKNRGGILGFINAAATGGSALSAVIFGVLGDIFPLYLVFIVGSILSSLPLIYMCLHKNTKAFILEN